MKHKAVWMGHPMRLEFTLAGLLVKLANHYKSRGTLTPEVYSMRNFSLKSELRQPYMKRKFYTELILKNSLFIEVSRDCADKQHMVGWLVVFMAYQLL